jgi:hypothetical protein
MPNNVERSTPFNSESHIWLPQFFYSRWLSALSSIRNDPEGAKCPKQSLSPRPLARVRQPRPHFSPIQPFNDAGVLRPSSFADQMPNERPCALLILGGSRTDGVKMGNIRARDRW